MADWETKTDCQQVALCNCHSPCSSANSSWALGFTCTFCCAARSLPGKSSRLFTHDKFYGCYCVFQSKLKKINEKWDWSRTKRTDAAAASRRISTWWLPAHFPVWMRRMWLGDRGLAFGASAFSAAALATLAFSRGFGFAKSWNPMAACAKDLRSCTKKIWASLEPPHHRIQNATNLGLAWA